jgi:hypothetical protein
MHVFACSLVFLPECNNGCLQITIHQNLWNWLAISPISKFGTEKFRNAAGVDDRF